MRSLLVVMIHPVSNPVISIVEVQEGPLPGAFLLEAAEEPFNHPVLFRGIGRDVLLGQLVLCDRLMEALGSKHKAIVRANDQSMLAGHDFLTDQRVLQGAGGKPGFTRLRETPADKVSIVAINQGNQVAPAILLGEYVGHVDRPAAVDLGRDALHSLRPGPIAIGALPTLPALLLDDPVDLFPVYNHLPFPAEHHGDPPCPVFGEALDDVTDGLDQLRIWVDRFLGLCLGGVVYV